MPYFIEKNNKDCKSGWAVTGATGVVHGCHTTKASAIKQAVAISLSTDEPFAGERAAMGELSVGSYVTWDPENASILGEVEVIAGPVAAVRVYELENGVFTPSEDIFITNILKLTSVPKPPFIAEKYPAETPDTMDTPLESDPMNEITADASRSRWIKAAWAIKARLENLPEEARSLGGREVRTTHADFEIREDGDGLVVRGYAALFDSPSHPLPFVETIQRGAFKKSLQSRNRILLLWNHNAGEPLASNRNGSLKLYEDEKGLAYEARMANTSRARDVSELLRSGVIDSMSFGFSVKRDAWSQDGNNRTLQEVSLHEISIVSYPAYEGTAGTVSVRENRDIDADALADSLSKLEVGSDLTVEEAQVINEIVQSLTAKDEAPAVVEAEPTIEELEANLLELKRKQLDLMLKKGI
jgi:HK97 family phage prohead protease